MLPKGGERMGKHYLGPKPLLKGGVKKGAAQFKVKVARCKDKA